MGNSEKGKPTLDQEIGDVLMQLADSPAEHQSHILKSAIAFERNRRQQAVDPDQ